VKVSVEVLLVPDCELATETPDIVPSDIGQRNTNKTTIQS